MGLILLNTLRLALTVTDLRHATLAVITDGLRTIPGNLFVDFYQGLLLDVYLGGLRYLYMLSVVIVHLGHTAIRLLGLRHLRCLSFTLITGDVILALLKLVLQIPWSVKALSNCLLSLLSLARRIAIVIR